MKILLVPWGRGMGHITRCLAIGTHGANSNNQDQVYIVAEAQWDTLIKQVGCVRVSYPQELTSAGPWENWENVDYMRKSLSADFTMLEKVQPDVVLHDRRPTMPIACELARIPCVLLAQCGDRPNFVYSDKVDSQPFWKEKSPAFNAVLYEHGLRPLNGDWRDLLFRNPVFVPSIPEFDPFPKEMVDTQVWYTGPLLLSIEHPSLLPEPERRVGIPIIFVYGVIKNQHEMTQLLTIFQDGLFHLVITALPANVDIPKYIKDLSNISIYPFVNVPRFLQGCDVAIIHGGHGSCMAALTSGTPVVILTDSSQELERTYNARRLEEMGIAQCLPRNVMGEKLYDTVKNLAQEPLYHQNAQHWQTYLRQWNGPKTAWEMLTRLGTGLPMLTS